MYEEKAQTAMAQANELFQIAQDELARPEEDVVPYSVYRNAFKSVNKYLSAYLMQHGIDAPDSMTLDMLINRCREIDPRFNDLKLDPLFSTSETEDVWMDMETGKEFIHLAEQTRKMVGIT